MSSDDAASGVVIAASGVGSHVIPRQTAGKKRETKN